MLGSGDGLELLRLGRAEYCLCHRRIALIQEEEVDFFEGKVVRLGIAKVYERDEGEVCRHEYEVGTPFQRLWEYNPVKKLIDEGKSYHVMREVITGVIMTMKKFLSK
jgi:hypothetical protein